MARSKYANRYSRAAASIDEYHDRLSSSSRDDYRQDLGISGELIRQRRLPAGAQTVQPTDEQHELAWTHRLHSGGSYWKHITVEDVQFIDKHTRISTYAANVQHRCRETFKRYARIVAREGHIPQATCETWLRLLPTMQHHEYEGQRFKGSRRRQGMTQPVSLDTQMAQRLHHPGLTSIRRRDATLMTFLLYEPIELQFLPTLRLRQVDFATGQLQLDASEGLQHVQLASETLAAIHAMSQDIDSEHDYLFRATRGSTGKNPMTERALFKRVREIGTRCGIQNLSPSDCQRYQKRRGPH